MPYIAQKLTRNPSADELRERIPGWGADLDPADRPSYPRERFAPQATGAHWVLPERQPELQPRERSIEHQILPPVFGTAQPLRGPAGVLRRLSYARYSEGRAAHWLLLLLADRVDAIQHHLRSLFSLRPDNPITQTGVLSESRYRPLHSRFGRNRADVKHMWMDPIIVAAPGVIALAVVLGVTRRLTRQSR